MGKEVAIFVLPLLLALTLYDKTTLVEAKSIFVNWTKEERGNWLQTGTVIYEGDKLEFVFDQMDYNVVAGKNAYETCKKPYGAFEFNSGDDEVLVEKGENFFACTKKDCCENDMKMKFTAVAGPRPIERVEMSQVRSGQDNQDKSWVRLTICYMFLFLLII